MNKMVVESLHAAVYRMPNLATSMTAETGIWTFVGVLMTSRGTQIIQARCPEKRDAHPLFSKC